SFLSFPFHMLPPLISTLFPYTTLFRSAYVLSSVATYDQQIEAFEYGRKDPVLLKRNERIMQVYNAFANRPTLLNVLKTMVYSALLEGLFFYSGFDFFYHLARHQKMVGSTTMI